MPRYKLIAFSNPKPGQDAAYNEWYNKHHLPELLSVPGIKSAKRLKQTLNLTKTDALLPYVAIYEVETDNIGAVLGGMQQKATTRSDAMDYPSASLAVYEEL